MARDRFINPATSEDYGWPRNHDVQSAGARQREVTEIQPTAAGWTDVKSIRQQGADSPLILRLEGNMTGTQHAKFLFFWKLCAKQTIHYVSCFGERYEVFFTSYEPQRKGVLRGPNGADHTRRYTLELEVVSQLA